MAKKAQNKGAWPELTDLTPREYDVLQLCALGLNNKEIALKLNISVHTVKLHIKNLLKKFSEPTRESIMLIATRIGLVSPGHYKSLNEVLKEKFGNCTEE